MTARWWASSPAAICSAPRRSDGDILVHLITGLDGVVAVEAHLRYAYDDNRAKVSTEARVR